jgi:hypothetical protein
MEVYVNGKEVRLSQKDFVAKGGQGSIYKRGNTAFKIFEDIRQVIPLAKIKELAILEDPCIIKPIYPIFNNKKHHIGYTMLWLGNNTHPLCKFFTNKFRDTQGITNDSTVELVENIKKKTHYVHQKGCLIVDGNELNYLVDHDLTTPYFIDVDPWKTRSFPPMAIMPSIRDWTTNEFNEMTDWFSFAIVSFQLFIGIHPFKGKHKSFRKNDFRNRVLKRVSVFNSEVSLPHSVRDFNLIPTSYKDWYFSIFEHGNRTPPPDLPGEFKQIAVVVDVINSTNNFEIREIFEALEKIIYHNPETGVTKTQKRIYLNKTDYNVQNSEVVFTHLEKAPIFVKIISNQVQFKSPTHEIIPIDLSASELMITNNILYLRNKEKLLQMDFRVIGNEIHPLIKSQWKIEKNSSILFSNVVYQNVHGSTFLSFPLSTQTNNSFIIKQVPELDNYRIIDAKHENRVCVLTGHMGSSYTRIIITFDEKYNKYSVRIVDDVDFSSINFITLDNGVCVLITDDDAVEIFLNRPDVGKVKRIEDPIVNNNMKLCKDGTFVKFYRDNKVYSMKMK